LVVVTHDPQVAASCGRTLRLHDGHIAASQAADDEVRR
jgi:predicted ABC-type transport system involved in lysophospholipase L1 biosynthesis ATPase subunit